MPKMLLVDTLDLTRKQNKKGPSLSGPFSNLLRLLLVALALVLPGVIPRRWRSLSLGRGSRVWRNFAVLAWPRGFTASYVVHLLWLQRASGVVLHRRLPL